MELEKPSVILESMVLPSQDTSKLSFCKGQKVADVCDWVNSLKATQVSLTSAELYRAIPEINRLRTTFKVRLEMLECLRPSVQHSIVGLTKSFLHQSIGARAEAQKSIIVAQALQKHMIEGYTICVRQIAKEGRARQTTLKLLATAIHRAIVGVGLLFLRSYQLYTQFPRGNWKRLHSLFKIAYFYDLLNHSVNDSLLTASRGQSIHDAYIRVLMLASSKCDQLGQNEIATCYKIFETWSNTVNIVPLDEINLEQHVYKVDINSDFPPFYKNSFDKKTEFLVTIDFTSLLSAIDKQPVDNRDDSLSTSGSIQVPRDFSASLLNHLVDSWTKIPERKFDRRDIQGSAEVCVGLVDCHYFLCNGQDFSYFVKNSGSSEESVSATTPSVFTPLDAKSESKSSFDRPAHRVTLQNVSSGGYCILWKGEIPSKLESGELIGIKEIGRRTWSIGAVRWIKQLKSGSQLGVQLLSSQPKPFAAAKQYDMGGFGDYSRAIYLPTSRFSDKTSSLLTPAALFTEFDKVQVLDGDQDWSGKLLQQVFATGAVRQFKFKPIDHDGEEDTLDESDSFKSTWDGI